MSRILVLKKMFSDKKLGNDIYPLMLGNAFTSNNEIVS